MIPAVTQAAVGGGGAAPVLLLILSAASEQVAARAVAMVMGTGVVIAKVVEPPKPMVMEMEMAPVEATVREDIMENGKMPTYKLTTEGDNLSFGTGTGAAWGDLGTYNRDYASSCGSGAGAPLSGSGDSNGEGIGAGNGDGSGWGHGRWEDVDL